MRVHVKRNEEVKSYERSIVHLSRSSYCVRAAMANVGVEISVGQPYLQRKMEKGEIKEVDGS